MHSLKSSQLAWSIAIASLALWATNAPVSWGALATGSARLLDQSDSGNTTTIDIQQGVITTVTDDVGAQSAQCPTIPPAIVQLIPPTPTPEAAPAAAAQQGSFRICGSDPQTAHAVEQLIAGRGFSASLTAHGDGCADLTIRVSPGAVSGSSSSNLSVSLASGRNLNIQISSEQGVTHASIQER